MSIFDPFHQARINNFLKSKVSRVSERDFTLDELKKLAGTDQKSIDSQAVSTLSGADKARIMKERNIKPGTEEWFRLHFAKTWLTGEKPFE